MPVPTLITDFTGTDENPLSDGGNWARLDTVTPAALIRVGNQAGGTAAAASYWTAADFGPDLEAYVTISTLSGTTNGIAARIQGAGGSSTWDGYRVIAVAAETRISVVTNNIFTTIFTTSSVSWASGDKLGIRLESNMIQAWRQPSGDSNWSLVCSVSDETYTGAGKMGLYVGNSTTRLDDFYAATDSDLFGPNASVNYVYA